MLSKRLINAGGVSVTPGAYMEGGVVFYAVNGLALVASLTTSSTAAPYGCAYYGFTPAPLYNTYGTGDLNTDVLFNQCPQAGIVAKLIRAYTGGGYTDWYHPNLIEMTELVNVVGTNPSGLGNLSNLIVNQTYTTSNEVTSGMSFGVSVSSTGGSTAYLLKNNSYLYKAIRKFNY